jgi:TonB family protein
MRSASNLYLSSIFLITVLAVLLNGARPALAQSTPITYVQILTALNAKVPNARYKTRAEVVAALTVLIKERGVDKPLSAAIEDLLVQAGATDQLLATIREHSPEPPKPMPAATPTPRPAPTPTPIDVPALLARAEASLDRGQLTAALGDYDKAIDAKSDDPAAFVGRGRTHYRMYAFEKAVTDLTRAIELDPKRVTAYSERAAAYERMDKWQLAIADYQKVTELDAANEEAKLRLRSLRAEHEKPAAASPPPAVSQPPAQPPDAGRPQLGPVAVGNLTQANALKLAMPVYPPYARRATVNGEVVVQVELDEIGNVTSARAISGHNLLRSSAEDAAMRSRFKPVMYNGKPAKATGTIRYKF